MVTSVNDDDKTNKFATIEKEQRSGYEQLDPFDEDKQLPPYNRPGGGMGHFKMSSQNSGI